MKDQSFLKGILFSLCLLSFSTFSYSQNVNIPFENPSSFPVNCGDTWVESGIQQQIGPNPGCYFFWDPSYGLFIGGKLTLDLSPLSNITQIILTLQTTCGAGATTAEFFDANGNLVGSISNTQSVPNQISFTPMTPIATMCVIGTCEETVSNILIINPDACTNTPNPQVTAESGDVYIEDVCYGVILTSPSGACFRIRVDDLGLLISEPVVCP